MAPFQLRVRTLYPRTQPVPSTPLSIRSALRLRPMFTLARSALSTYTRRPLSPELRTTTPPHRTPWAQRAGFTHLPGEVHLHSLGSTSSYSDTASCPAGHTAELLAVTSMSKSAAVSLTGRSPLSASAGARPPTGLTNSVPLRSSHPLCPEPYDVELGVYHPHRHSHHRLGANLDVSDTCTSYPFPLCPLSSSTTAPPSPPSARSAPYPLPHRRHRLRDDRPTAHVALLPQSLSNSPYSSIFATAVPRNLSTSRYTSRAHTDSRRRPSPERASSYPDASPLSLRYRWQTIPNPFSQTRVLTAHR